MPDSPYRTSECRPVRAAQTAEMGGIRVRREWERRLDSLHWPDLPAAVRTYDPADEIRTVSFDLDCKEVAGRAAVL